MSTYFYMRIEIELPDDVSEEYQDAMVDDLIYALHVERLENLIKRWVRFITGESCNVEIKVDE